MNIQARWHKLLASYQLALSSLEHAVQDIKNRNPTRLEQLGFIQMFESCYALAWLTLQAFFIDQGDTLVDDDRISIRLAFRRGAIEDGEIWMAMLKTNLKTAHFCKPHEVSRIAKKIINDYYPAFEQLNDRLSQEKIRQASWGGIYGK